MCVYQFIDIRICSETMKFILLGIEKRARNNSEVSYQFTDKNELGSKIIFTEEREIKSRRNI